MRVKACDADHTMSTVVQSYVHLSRTFFQILLEVLPEHVMNVGVKVCVLRVFIIMYSVKI